MPFRIDEFPDRIVARDTPIGMWVFGSVFVITGLAVLSIPFASTAWSGFVLWERASIVAIGVGHFLGGAWTVWSQVETRTTFDRATNEGLHLVRRPFARRPKATSFSVSEVKSFDLARSTDSEGDPMYQVRMWLSGSRVLSLQGQAVHGEARAKTAEFKLRRALGLS